MSIQYAPVPATSGGPIVEFMESHPVFFSILFIATGILFIYAGISNIMMVFRIKKKSTKQLWKEYRSIFLSSGIGILGGVLFLVLGLFLTTKI